MEVQKKIQSQARKNQKTAEVSLIEPDGSQMPKRVITLKTKQLGDSTEKKIITPGLKPETQSPLVQTSQEDSIDRIKRKFMIRQQTGELVDAQQLKPLSRSVVSDITTG